jgi:hypothetical protein
MPMGAAKWSERLSIVDSGWRMLRRSLERQIVPRMYQKKKRRFGATRGNGGVLLPDR